MGFAERIACPPTIPATGSAPFTIVARSSRASQFFSLGSAEPHDALKASLVMQVDPEFPN